MQHKLMTDRQMHKAREIFRAMSEPARPEDDVIEALEADAEAHEAAARECRRAAGLLRDRQRVGDVRRAMREGA